ncbi:MAG: hypothetical protein C4562_03520 [Actinobacteria bacterium]|nr:MAG: hypothetical protein C4562_03520 [Actinomycetota bacterium]
MFLGLIKRLIYNRIFSAIVIIVAAFFCFSLSYKGFKLISAIPSGPTTWHDYSGPGFDYIILGLPLSFLFSWTIINVPFRQPSRIVTNAAMMIIFLTLFFNFATK